jgi:hypothetical protein
VHREKNAALVEYVEKGSPKRAVVPAEAVAGIKEGEIGDDVLEAAIPYGDDFGSLRGVTVDIVDKLHGAGIWTKADVLARSQIVRKAVQQALVPPIMTRLLEFAKEE